MLRQIHAQKKRIRVKKEDSAFVYFILEASQGSTSYSTLDSNWNDAFRDIELIYSPDFETEVDGILKRLGDLVYVLPPE